MRIRAILLITIIFAVIPAKSEMRSVTTCGTSMTVAGISLHERNYPPHIMFVGVPIGNTLRIDSLDTMSSFINNICEQSIYISTSSILFSNGMYISYFGLSLPIIESSWRVCEEYFNGEKEYSRNIKIQLKDSTDIDITYFDIYGFFVYGDKNILYQLHHTGSTLEIAYMRNDYIKDVWYIMSIVCSQPTAGDFIQINPAYKDCIIEKD